MIEGPLVDCSIKNTLQQVQKVSFECILLLFFCGRFVGPFLFRKLIFHFVLFYRSIPFGLWKVLPRFGKLNAFHCQVPFGCQWGMTMVVGVGCCRQDGRFHFPL